MQYLTYVQPAGKKVFSFSSMMEFLAWKEKVEETTSTSYVKTQQTYSHPRLEGMCTMCYSAHNL